jgi:hypothetical protein
MLLLKLDLPNLRVRTVEVSVWFNEAYSMIQTVNGGDTVVVPKVCARQAGSTNQDSEMICKALSLQSGACKGEHKSGLLTSNGAKGWVSFTARDRRAPNCRTGMSAQYAAPKTLTTAMDLALGQYLPLGGNLFRILSLRMHITIMTACADVRITTSVKHGVKRASWLLILDHSLN